MSSFSGYSRQLLWGLFLAQSWALWNTRNKLAIEKKTISNPADIIYKTIIFLQLWSLKFKSREKEGLSWMARKLKELYVALKPAAQHREEVAGKPWCWVGVHFRSFLGHDLRGEA